MKCLRRRSKDLRLDDWGGNDRYALLKKRCEMRSLGRFDCPNLCRNCVPVENKTAACIAASGCLSSGTSGNRTSDTRIFSPLLYQLSYGTIVSGGCRSLLQTLRAIAMLCLTRCECKGKQKISTSKRFGRFLHFIFIGALDRLMLNLYDYVCKCMLCNLLCEICGCCEVFRRGGFRL